MLTSLGKGCRRRLPLTAALLLLLSGLALGEPLDPLALQKYVDALPRPGIMPPVNPGGTEYEVGVWPIAQQLHSQLPPTSLWGYGPTHETATYPGATFEVTRHVPIEVHWTNNLVDETGNPITHPLPVDQTLHWADPLGTGHSTDPYTGPVPVTTHVHGGEFEPQSDGHPDTWFTPNFAITGPGWVHETYRYVNEQPPATIWYHDHALGITRLNVYMGLAGFYLIRDPGNEPEGLPSGDYEIPIAIQDRMLTEDGQLEFPDDGINEEHPYWQPEFFGDLIVVNGKIWPYLDVEPRKYRFRLLNGSDARFYALKLVGAFGNPGPAFTQIGTDGGYLEAPVVLNDPLNPNAPRLLMAPGERADIVIDFSDLAPGTTFIMSNNAKSPFPKGEPVNPQTTGQIMQFRVVAGTPDETELPAVLNTIPDLGPAVLTRTMTLNEIMGPGGPLAMFLDGKMWGTAATELPTVGSTELWELVNLTADTHPIHLHLVQFQLLNRQGFRVTRYLNAYDQLNPVIPAEVTFNPPLAPYLIGQPKAPDPNEAGWKDTIRMNPGEVTRLLVRFAPIGTPEVTPYGFDATADPGYVWHCHILEHEDNEMMRPYKLQNAGGEPLIAMQQGAAQGGAQALDLQASAIAHRGANIQFTLSAPGHARLSVFDVAGREVTRLLDADSAAGAHVLQWDGTDRNGRQAPSGVYFYRLSAGAGEQVRKTVLLR